MAPSSDDDRYVYVDCRSSSTRLEWCHKVRASQAAATVAEIEATFADVTATVRSVRRA